MHAWDGDVKCCHCIIIIAFRVAICDALSEEKKTIPLAQVTFRLLAKLVILIDFVNIKVTRLALLKLATTRSDEMRLQVSSLPLLISLTVREYALLDHYAWAVFLEVDKPFT